MTSCQCQGCEEVFDDETATRDMNDYRNSGPDDTTEIMLDAIAAQGVENASLIDIGGGAGVVQFELLEKGIGRVTSVDAASEYLAVSKREAERRGLLDKIDYHHGNFVEIAPQLEAADIVTLDRVLCCFDDMRGLVDSSSKLAKRVYGLVFPRDLWWVKIGFAIGNFFGRFYSKHFNIFVHATEEVDTIVQGNGLRRVFYKPKGVWQVIVYAR
jgi:magnesium-protoporphyrin O-methyltransferase